MHQPSSAHYRSESDLLPTAAADDSVDGEGVKRRPAGQAWIVIGYLLPDTFPIPKTILVDICRPQLRLCFRETVRVRVMNIVAEVKSYRFGVRLRLLRSESLNKVGEKNKKASNKDVLRSDKNVHHLSV